MRRKKEAEQDAPATGPGRITPVEVQQVEFRLAFRGYNERDVDAFLDRITEDLAAYLEENERLRSGAGLAPSAAPAAGADADSSGPEAEAILARAREEAAAIVRRAEQQASAIGAAGAAASSGDPRSAIAPFLNTEREFLQSLGSLVQTHAEEIKEMVLALRERTRPEPEPAEAEPGSEPEGEAEAAAASGATAAEIRERLVEPEGEPVSRAGPVVIESATEPAYSSEGAPANENRERSLRDLFWGED
jgi:DivIVA domain-containing protein